MRSSKQRVTAVTLEMLRCSYGKWFQASLRDSWFIVRCEPALKRGAKVKRRSAATLLQVFHTVYHARSYERERVDS